MTNKNGAKGAEAERAVAKYLQEFWPEARRALGAGRKDDRGDIYGVPHTVVQVKDCQSFELPKWIAGTLRQRDNDQAPLCALAVKKKYKPVKQWDCYLPLSQFVTDAVLKDAEGEAWTWMRTDLATGVYLLSLRIDEFSPPYSPTTE